MTNLLVMAFQFIHKASGGSHGYMYCVVNILMTKYDTDNHTTYMTSTSPRMPNDNQRLASDCIDTL
jgi:hypothetical protein